MNLAHRKLTNIEIDQLQQNGCSAADWNLIEVKDGFCADYVRNTFFSGTIRLGVFEKIFILEGGMPKHSGIYRATLHNCEVEDNVLISDIHNHIANYKIEDDCCIRNVGTMATTKGSSFGNGVKVAVLDETGGREVVIHDRLSSHQAYISAFWKYKPAIINRLDELIDGYVRQKISNRGYVGRNSNIVNVMSVENVRIEEHSKIDSAVRLENGTVCRNAYVGHDVIAKDFIFSSDSHVVGGAKINRCFVGEACHIGNGFSAADSFFFANCHMENGEACALFAGPYTVSHHKSTLLIGALFSFMNAGSGSNQSNHMYKLGPMHYGVGERGVKLASDSYIAWPARIGAFSLVMGKHYGHWDVSAFPFSYLVEDNAETYLIPAINAATIGTYRDAQKWPSRDRRETSKTDCLSFSLLNPYIGQKVSVAIELLNRLEKEPDEDGVCRYDGCVITSKALQRGKKVYQLILDKYLGDMLISHFEKRDEPEKGSTDEWIDLCGLIVPQECVYGILENIVGLEQLNGAFADLLEQTSCLEWKWAKAHIGETDNKQILDNWLKASTELCELMIKDASKEFADVFKLNFGLDGSETDKQSEFESIRGSADTENLIRELKNSLEADRAIYNKLVMRL
ncbi:MAG: DUF4954 family protein [Dysgonomonas sp.]